MGDIVSAFVERIGPKGSGMLCCTPAVDDGGLEIKFGWLTTLPLIAVMAFKFFVDRSMVTGTGGDC